MGIQRQPAIASSCPLFLDALRSLAHHCLVRVSEGQSAKREEQCPLGSGLAPIAITLAKAGAAAGETVSWKLKLLMQKQRGWILLRPLASNIRTGRFNRGPRERLRERCRACPHPRKPHPVGLLPRGSTSRQADEKRRVKARKKPLNWTGARGALVAATGGRITFRQEQQTTGDAMQYDGPDGWALPSPSSWLASLLTLLSALACSAVSHPALLTSNVPAEQNFRMKNSTLDSF
ncbi:hypothetical protein NDU88_002537 [Pleurodeles waltl]|uniref:Uncharacterized protein n=1 Tax=Pleurodeles waltl TaxID=8319 RepID=A0AAV7TLY0_PLEWA|nr:hypothetical protein NDU88_002537 [Pleurodeles waltl]